jgi:WS/DGAT/MGAT family acyltransferase
MLKMLADSSTHQRDEEFSLLWSRGAGLDPPQGGDGQLVVDVVEVLVDVGGRVGGAVGVTALPLTEVRAVAKAWGLTINDVLMTLCAGAIRRWLDEAGELPDRPLVAAVPVALHDQEHRAGNRVSAVFASLPTHLVDPSDRLEFVRRIMRDAKATHADVRPDTLGALAEATPWNVVGLIFRAYSDLGLASRLPPAVNLVFSNVPGPPVPVYCGGAQLVGLYALGPIFDGTGLNVTFATCGDQIDVGIVTCPDVAPPLDSLVSGFARALEELVTLEHGQVTGTR